MFTWRDLLERRDITKRKESKLRLLERRENQWKIQDVKGLEKGSKLRLLERRKIDGDKVLGIVKSEANESSQSPLTSLLVGLLDLEASQSIGWIRESLIQVAV